jgi:oligopeptide/dipeptide ABC transporter ATP-binding protein
MHLLEVNGLSTCFFTHKGIVPAVSNVQFTVDKSKVVAIVGESGSGKSVTAQSILRLVSKPGKIMEGEVLFNNEDLLKKSTKEICRIRGRDISMIFQEPMTSLNPVIKCGNQIREVLRLHSRLQKKEEKEYVIELLNMVGIPEPKRRLNEYPHQLSGGMRQRIMIAIAIACEPQLLIADEPTTALDVTIQAQILDLIKDLQKKMKMSILLITHDFGIVAKMADEVIVMYTGKVLEQGSAYDVLNNPLHPYTQGLLESIPTLESGGKHSKEKLYCIKGMVPSLLELPKGCSFSPRCEKAMDICYQESPKLIVTGDNRKVSCWLHERSSCPHG